MRPILHKATHTAPARSATRRTGRLLQAALLLLVLCLAAACDGGHKEAAITTPGPGGATAAAAGGFQSPRTPAPPPVATPKPSPNSSETAQKYLALWQQGQYAAMYDLLTTAAKQSIAQDKFTGRYQAIADEATITAVKTNFTPASDKQADQLPFSVTYTTALFGEVKQDLTMPLAREADGWRVQWSPSLIFKSLGTTNLVHTYIDTPPRAAILARDGTPLAITANVGVVGTSRALMNSPQVKDKQAAITALAQKLGLNTADVQKKIDDPNTPEDYFIPIKTLPYNEPADQRSAIEAIPGAIVQDTPQRTYPLGPNAAHVVGYVTKITADELAKLRGEGYGSEDLVGQSGLEASFEQQLAGKRGARLAIISPDGQVVEQLAQRPGKPPEEVVTTIDVKAQNGAIAALSNGDHIGSLVMLDPNDNSVLAMASWPSFDPNWFVQGLTDAQAAQVSDEKRKPLLNRATLGTYPSGSTFKVVTASAGLEKDGLTPTSTLPCPPVWYGLGQNLPKKNWRPDNLGNITITDALMTSCDPVFYEIGLELDKRDPNILPSFAAAFGYGHATGINGAQEADGLDPNPDWKQKTLNESWFSGDSVNLAIGQGYLLVTPLQVVNAYSAIARGDLRTPLLVSQLRPGVADAQPETFASKVIGQLPISQSTLGVLREGIRRVVQDPRGTAYDVFKGSQLNAAGKSGTAEDVGLDHVSFVAYAPVTGPKAVSVAVLDTGQSGSLEAGPIVRKALETYLLGR